MERPPAGRGLAQRARQEHAENKRKLAEQTTGLCDAVDVLLVEMEMREQKHREAEFRKKRKTAIAQARASAARRSQLRGDLAPPESTPPLASPESTPPEAPAERSSKKSPPERGGGSPEPPKSVMV